MKKLMTIIGLLSTTLTISAHAVAETRELTDLGNGEVIQISYKDSARTVVCLDRPTEEIKIRNGVRGILVLATGESANISNEIVRCNEKATEPVITITYVCSYKEKPGDWFSKTISHHDFKIATSEIDFSHKNPYLNSLGGKHMMALCAADGKSFADAYNFRLSGVKKTVQIKEVISE